MTAPPRRFPRATGQVEDTVQTKAAPARSTDRWPSQVANDDFTTPSFELPYALRR